MRHGCNDRRATGHVMKYQNRLNLNRLVCFSKREKLSNQSAIFAAQFLGIASEPRQYNNAVG